jgi:GTP-binding protein
MDFSKVQFMLSAHSLGQLPDPIYPDIAFAGRSNVGKSSLINRLVRRANLVKTSSRPGKTQSLNYFLVDEGLYLVDLPGYGFAQVSQQTRKSWQGLITRYVETRSSLVCMVVIIDLRHELKKLDRELIDWLRYLHKPFLPVYTKADKLGRNDQRKNAALLDAGLTLTPADRIIFSSRTGQGLDQLKTKIAALVTGFQGSDEAADNDLTDPI